MTVKKRAVGGGRAAVLAAGLAAGLAAPEAVAHPEFSAMGTNRYVTVAVFDGHVDVTDAWLHGALTAAETRRALDTNGDGQVDPGELGAAQEKLRAEGPFVTVELDGHAATAPLALSIDLGGETRVGAAPVVIERRVRLSREADARETQVRLTVTREPARLVETELSIVLGPGLTLPHGPDRVRFDGPRRSSLETRAATFVVASSAPPATRGRGLAMVAAVVLAGVGLIVWIRSRGRKTPRRQDAKPGPDQIGSGLD
jgi:hypothetical protein